MLSAIPDYKTTQLSALLPKIAKLINNFRQINTVKVKGFLQTADSIKRTQNFKAAISIWLLIFESQEYVTGQNAGSVK